MRAEPELNHKPKPKTRLRDRLLDFLKATIFAKLAIDFMLKYS